MGGILAAIGLLTLIWVFIVWRWQDPFTGLYTRWEQHKLAQQLQHELATQPWPKFVPSESLAAEARAIELAAARFRRTAKAGQAIGRIIDMVDFHTRSVGCRSPVVLADSEARKQPYSRI